MISITNETSAILVSLKCLVSQSEVLNKMNKNKVREEKKIIKRK